MIAGFIEILSENEELIDLIGQDKIYPVVIPEDTAPTYLAVSLARTVSEDTTDAVAGLETRTVNVNIHAKDYDTLDEVASAIREAVDGITATTDTGHVFQKIVFRNEYDRPDLFTADRPLYARSIEFHAIIKR